MVGKTGAVVGRGSWIGRGRILSKRLFDILVSSVLLVLMSPIMVILALAVKLDSKGPVFYKGIRVGRKERPFRVLKFRSMVDKADQLGADSTSLDDKRITRIGHVIRKYKLDELPQLINVLKGEMSVVGPRPQVPWAVETYEGEARRILELRPGITDWASIKFNHEEEILRNSNISDPDEAYMKLIHPEKVRLQLKYVKERSLWVDLTILVGTIEAVLRARFSRTSAR